jgi:hypothetical protein
MDLYLDLALLHIPRPGEHHGLIHDTPDFLHT